MESTALQPVHQPSDMSDMDHQPDVIQRKIAEARLDLQLCTQDDNFRLYFDKLLNELIAPSQLPKGSAAQKVVTDLQKLLIKHRDKAVQLQEKVLTFGSSISILRKELEVLGGMISNTLENSTRKIKIELYRTQFDSLNDQATQLKKQIQDFQDSYLSIKDNEEISLVKSQLYLVFPKDTLSLVEDYQHGMLLATQSKYATINQYYQELMDEYSKVIIAQSEKMAAEKQIELVDKEVLLIQKDQFQIEETINTLKETMLTKQENRDDMLDDLQCKYKMNAEKLNSDVSKYTERLNESIQNSVGFVDKALEDFSMLKIEDIPYHFVLVCDESGSMSDYFNDLKAAFKVFIKTLDGGSKNNMVSVVMFESKARITIQARAISQDLEIDPRGGGTCFKEAFKQVDYCLEQTSVEQTPVIIFMTDGDDYSGTTFAINLLKQRFQKCADTTKLITFVIGFGRDVKDDQLKAICQAGNGGTLSRSVNGIKMGMYFQCLGNHSELQNAFAKISKSFNPIINGNLSKVEIMKQQKQNIIQDLESQSKKMNQISSQNLNALQQRITLIRTKLDENANAGIQQIKNDIADLEKKKELCLNKITLKTQARQKLCETVAKRENELKEYLGVNYEQQDLGQNSVRIKEIIFENQTHPSSTSTQQLDKASENSSSLEKKKEIVIGSYYQKEEKILRNIKEIQESQSNKEDLIEKRRVITNNLKDSGIIMEDPEEYIKIRSTIQELDNLISDRRKYQLLIVRFMKEITYHVSKVEERLQNLDSDLIDRSIIVVVILKETLDANNIEYKEDAVLKSFVQHRITADEVQNSKVKKFLNDNITVANLQPKLNEKTEAIEIRKFEKNVTKTLAPKMERLNKKLNGISDKISAIEEKEEKNGSLTEKEEAQKEKLEEEKDRLQDQMLDYQDEQSMIDEAVTFYSQTRAFIADQIAQKNKIEYLNQLRTAFKAIIHNNIPSISFLLHHIKQVEASSAEAQMLALTQK